MTRRAAVVAWLLIAALPGCIDRDRVNTNCEWMGDTRFPIDSRNAGHQDHLVRDAQLAEELATRYADAEHERRFGYGGHGGLIDNGRVHHDCLARLVAAIQTNHGVTSEQVRAARAHRDWRFDLAVAALFLPLYWYGATVVCRGLARRFGSDEPRVRIVSHRSSSVSWACKPASCGRPPGKRFASAMDTSAGFDWPRGCTRGQTMSALCSSAPRCSSA